MILFGREIPLWFDTHTLFDCDLELWLFDVANIESCLRILKQDSCDYFVPWIQVN